MPTFQFYIKSNKVHEMKGANPSELKSSVIKYKAQASPPASAFSGAGKATGSAAAVGADDMRAARLARLGAAANSSSSGSPAAAAAVRSQPTSSGSVAAGAASSSSSSSLSSSSSSVPVRAPGAAAPAPRPAPPAAATAAAASLPSSTPILSASHLEIVQTLTDAMGFSLELAMRAVAATGTLEAALDWIESHQDESDGDLRMVEEAPSTAEASPAAAAPSSGISAEDAAAISAAEDELNATSISTGGVGGKKMTKEETEAFIVRRRAEKAAAEKVRRR